MKRPKLYTCQECRQAVAFEDINIITMVCKECFTTAVSMPNKYGRVVDRGAEPLTGSECVTLPQCSMPQCGTWEYADTLLVG